MAAAWWLRELGLASEREQASALELESALKKSFCSQK